MNHDLSDLRGAGQQHVHGFLSSQPIWLEDRFVPRPSVQAELDHFMESEQSAAIIVGPSGVGKTYQLCKQAIEYLRKGYVVLTYNVKQLEGALSPRDWDLGLVIERTLCRDLRLGYERSLVGQLVEIDELLEHEDRYLVVMFDAVGRFAFAGAGSPELLKSLSNLVRACAERGLKRMKFILTCSTSSWDRIPSADLLQWNLFWRGRPISMCRYTDEEFEIAYEKYMGEVPDTDPELFERVRAISKSDPFILWVISELPEEILPKLTTSAVFDAYYEKKIAPRIPTTPGAVDRGPEKERFFYILAEKMVELGRDDIPFTEISDDQKPTYESLLTDGILTTVQRQEPHPYYGVQPYHTRLTEYFLSRYLWQKYDEKIPLSILTDLLKKTDREGFYAFWEAIASYLGRFGTGNVFLELACARGYLGPQIAVKGLVELGRQRPEEEIGEILRLLFQQPEARPAALRVAVELHKLPQVRTELTNWMYEQPALVSNYIGLLWREYRDFRAEDIWDELGAIRKDLSSLSVREFRSDRSIRFLATVAWRRFVDECADEETVAQISQFISETWQMVLADPWLQPRGTRRVFVRQFRKGIVQFAEWMLRRFLEEFTSPEPERVQKLPRLPFFPEEMRRVARFLDPDLDPEHFDASKDDILHLLDVPIRPDKRIQVAAVAIGIAIQVLRNFEAVKPTWEYVWQHSDVPQRLALHAALSIRDPAPATISEDYLSTISRLTKDLLQQDREYLVGKIDPWGLSKKWEITLALTPVGFAHCNFVGATPCIEPILELIDELGGREDTELVRACIEGLIPIGIYFPLQTLHTLAEMGALETTDEQIAEQTRAALRIIQVFHARQVANFFRAWEGQIRPDIEPERLVGPRLDELLAYTQWMDNLNLLYHVADWSVPRYVLIGAILGMTTKQRASRLVTRCAKILVEEMFARELSLERFLNDPVDDPQAFIREIAGKGYGDQPQRSKWRFW